MAWDIVGTCDPASIAPRQQLPDRQHCEISWQTGRRV